LQEKGVCASNLTRMTPGLYGNRPYRVLDFFVFTKTFGCSLGHSGCSDYRGLQRRKGRDMRATGHFTEFIQKNSGIHRRFIRKGSGRKPIDDQSFA